nr:hypothetical protein [Tanacetum cinerariifolium]
MSHGRNLVLSNHLSVFRYTPLLFLLFRKLVLLLFKTLAGAKPCFDEYNALIKNGMWILVPKPAGVNMVCSIWLFKHKFHANGTLSRYKARLVANGSSQQQGIDVDETFSLVVKPATIRTILSLAVSRKWPIPFSIWTETSTSCLVLAFYKLCHSGWVLSQLLRYFSFYLPTGEFDMTDLGALNYFLGISATRSSTGLFLSQKKYACELLERANMVNCNPSRTPVDTDFKLGPEGVAQICLYMHDLREPHFPALKRILRYVRGDNLLSWSFKRQHTISRSSVEAEYRGVANVVAEAAWLRNLLLQHQQMKHIEIYIHFVRDMVQTGHIRVLHVPSRYRYADIFTKGGAEKKNDNVSGDACSDQPTKDNDGMNVGSTNYTEGMSSYTDKGDEVTGVPNTISGSSILSGMAATSGNSGKILTS